jgi:hypothetical protein
MHFVKHPCYAYVIWAFTFASLAVAIVQLNVDGRLQILLLSLEFLFGMLLAILCTILFVVVSVVASSEIN